MKPTKDLGRHQEGQCDSVSHQDLGVILVGARSKLWSGIQMCGRKEGSRLPLSLTSNRREQ